jgi:hypothetical protein
VESAALPLRSAADPSVPTGLGAPSIIARAVVVPLASYVVVPVNRRADNSMIPPVVPLIGPCVIGPVLPGAANWRRKPQACKC